MNATDFRKLCYEQYQHRMSIMDDGKKARVAGRGDRLIQFKRLAAIHMVSEAEVAMTLCSKQFTDLIDMASGNHPEYNNLNYLRELISDVQNYLDLLLAIETERIEEESDEAE